MLRKLTSYEIGAQRAKRQVLPYHARLRTEKDRDWVYASIVAAEAKVRDYTDYNEAVLDPDAEYWLDRLAALDRGVVYHNYRWSDGPASDAPPPSFDIEAGRDAMQRLNTWLALVPEAHAHVREDGCIGVLLTL